MSERVTIIIEPSDEHGGYLTIQDAMRQVLDFIEVVTAAANDDARLKFEWRLVEATTNSPFTAVAEAVSTDPEWPDIDKQAHDAKSRANTLLHLAYETGDFPGWLEEEKRECVKRLFQRNINGIAKTAYRFDGVAPPVTIVERRARTALEKIDRLEAEKEAQKPDYSGEELGAVEGTVLEALTHYGRPALRLRERLSGEKVICLIPEEKAEEIGRTHNWQEIWKGQRVLITGKIRRGSGGIISLITAEKVSEIEPISRPLADILDSKFTGRKSARTYLDDLWDGSGDET